MTLATELTDAQLVEAATMADAGATVAELAARFGLSRWQAHRLQRAAKRSRTMAGGTYERPQAWYYAEWYAHNNASSTGERRRWYRTQERGSAHEARRAAGEHALAASARGTIEIRVFRTDDPRPVIKARAQAYFDPWDGSKLEWEQVRRVRHG